MVENEISISLYNTIFCLFAIVLVCLLISIYCLLFQPDEKGSAEKHIKEWNPNAGTFQAAHPQRTRAEVSGGEEFVINLIPGKKG